MMNLEDRKSSIEQFISELTKEIVSKAISQDESKHRLSGLIATEEILEKLLEKTDLNIQLKAKYDEKCRNHNQYNLFNMLKLIPDFEIDEKLFEKLVFREPLLISERNSETNELTPVGGICIDVQKVEGSQPFARQMEEYETKLMKFLDKDGLKDHIDDGGLQTSEDPLEYQNTYGYSKFLVHVSSQFESNGKNGGSTITSWVDRNLHTLEELRKEFIVNPETINEKSLYMALKNKWYYCKHTSIPDEIDDRKLYSLNKAHNYLSEGASIILMRYLALTRYFGKFELICTYINGDLCRNIYECFGPEGEVVNNKKIDVCRIKRTIIEQCGITSVCLTLLTLNGQLIHQAWEDCAVELIINPCQNIKNEPPKCTEDTKLENTWENDMQLMSVYLDQKGICAMKNRTYITDHPELKQLIADYVNTILLLRPPDILQFTTKYFGDFLTPRFPRNEYLQ